MMRLWLPDTKEERYLSNYQVVRCEGCLQSFDLSHIFMYAFSRSNDLASLSVWWWLFQRIVMIVQNAEILSANRIKPAGTRPPQIVVEKPKKKPLTQSWTKLLFSRFKTKRVATYLTSRLRNLLSTGIREKTIPLKLSAVRSKNSSCSHLGTGTLVFRFAFLYRCWYVQPRCSPDLCMPTPPLKWSEQTKSPIMLTKIKLV